MTCLAAGIAEYLLGRFVCGLCSLKRTKSMNRVMFRVEKSLKMSKASQTVDTCGPTTYSRSMDYHVGVSPRELLNYRTFLKNIGVKLRVQRTKKLALAFIKLRVHDILYRSACIGKI